MKTTISEYDLHLFGEGNCLRIHEHLGAHVMPETIVNGVRGEGSVKVEKAGVRFGVWAPSAQAVSVVGDFNGWNHARHPMKRVGETGVWELWVPKLRTGELYRYEILTLDNLWVAHSDPYGFRMEIPPKSASIVWDLDGYSWHDADWLERRLTRPRTGTPISIYEVHLGSWRRKQDEGNRHLTYLELAESLPAYVEELGFNYVEIMPVAEHPFYGSWGYQQTGFYAPTSRYGTPQEFMALVDAFHRRNIGVILDWVPAHFPLDGFGLARFDGTALYEHLDPRQGFHQDWKTLIFNYGRNEVVNFLLSNALYWIDKYHIDGLRVDAVSSMLYRDYSRKEGEWVPNQYGGRENLEAIDFLRRVNSTIEEEHPGVMMIAEESTAFTGVTRASHLGGLGYTYKWNLGWMHDWLEFFSKDPITRKYSMGKITFSMWYAYAELYILMLGHDEVVHVKGSLLNKMPGTPEAKAANLRALLTMMFAHPGRKLLFMGTELAPWTEWNHDGELDWYLEAQPLHAGVRDLVKDLNRNYLARPELHALDDDAEGFEWIDCSDVDHTTFSWVRYGPGRARGVLMVANMTPVVRHNYNVGVPRAGHYREILNTSAKVYGGTGQGNLGGVDSHAEAAHGRPDSIALTLPPLSALWFELPPLAEPPSNPKRAAAPVVAAPVKSKPVKRSAVKPKAGKLPDVKPAKKPPRRALPE